MKVNVRKYMSLLVVSGTYKKHLFSKRVRFEISFYYTPIKKKIIDYRSEDLLISRLGIGQIIGHDITEIEQLCLDKGFSFFHIVR